MKFKKWIPGIMLGTMMAVMLHMLFRILFFVFGHPRKIEINRGCLCIKK